MSKRNAWGVLAVGIGASILLNACGGEAASETDQKENETNPGAGAADPSWLDGADDEWDGVFEAAQREGKVTVAGHPALAEPIKAAFERDTGIELEFLGGESSQLSERMEVETRAGNLTIDIMLGGGRELATLMPDDLLEPVAPQIILPGAAPEQFDDGKHLYYDDANQYLFIGSQYVFGWLVVNSDEIDPKEITSWSDLLDPKYRGKIISSDLRIPGPGQGVAGWMYQELGGIDFIHDLFVEQEVAFTTNTTKLVEDVARGTHPVAIGSIQHDVERFLSEGFDNIAIVFPEDAPGYLTSGYSVLKQAVGPPHPNAAQVFINWYASKPGQDVYESVMLETSRRPDVETDIPEYLVPQQGVDYWSGDDEKFYRDRPGIVEEIIAAVGDL